MKRILFAAVLVVAGVGLSPAPGAAAPKKGPDLIWTHPQAESLGIERIAMLPVVSFNGDLQAEKLVENVLASMLRETGFKWMTGSSTRVLLRNAAPDDSMLTVVRDDVKESPPVDSLLAPILCGRFRTDAVLSVRIDRWEQLKLDPVQTGKPYTTMQVKAALVDSLGRLVWTASGAERGEGALYDPDRNPYQTPGGGVTTQSLANLPQPPTYREVAVLLFGRWKEQFPHRVTEGD